MTDTPSFKDTVNLPQTDFPIRAGLDQKEPQLITQWETHQTHAIQQAQTQMAPKFVLHDGPPYPNGDIHMGHALNKILKDVIIRSKQMAGHFSLLVPGWDCHGLPIEMQVIKELKTTGESDKKNNIEWFRDRCKTFATGYVATQKNQFKRLGIWADWEAPYLTLNPGYEASVLKRFGEMAENGVIYKGRKPIHWCMSCETALAEAEIEYAPHRSPSIYVGFPITVESPALAAISTKPKRLTVWTTTPWTLPANVAIAAHPDFHYVGIDTGTEVLIVAEALADRLIETLSLVSPTKTTVINGSELVGTQTTHPLMKRPSPIVLADYVTQEDGTGFVHIAPGHGQDDYLVGQRYGLPTIMPVNDQGRYTSEVKWAGEKVFDANKLIGTELEEAGALLHFSLVNHSYPHCWRCKQPVIFRATAQWFVSMDTPKSHAGTTLRDHALAAIRATQWIPSWGENRIYTMVENRPDWCISRQRYWGIPIPVFTCQSCGNSEMTGEFNKAVVALVESEGTMAWFNRSAHDILPQHLTCRQCGARDFSKESDILDVWFESGASFGGVLDTNPNLQFPADLYLEGSDQHRGWFHSSLLIAMATRGQAPYKAVLTHGFLVDEKGRKMSKSGGNGIAPATVIKEYGADVLRWWVAGSDFKNDISIAKTILNQSRDTFSKVRNTIRFLLSNLYDYQPDSTGVSYANLESIDQWALHELSELNQSCLDAYAAYDFHLVTHKVHDYCAVNLSAWYLDIVKDRLYCDAPDGTRRRSTQTVLHAIADTLIRLIAPILAFTAEDAYQYFNAPNKAASVHTLPFATPPAEWTNPQCNADWRALLNLRDAVYQHLEPLRKDKVVKSFLEAKVTIYSPDPTPNEDLAAIFIVSAVEWVASDLFRIEVAVADGDKCGRCWKILPLNGGVCERCHAIVFRT